MRTEHLIDNRTPKIPAATVTSEMVALEEGIDTLIKSLHSLDEQLNDVLEHSEPPGATVSEAPPVTAPLAARIREQGALVADAVLHVNRLLMELRL